MAHDNGTKSQRITANDPIIHPPKNPPNQYKDESRLEISVIKDEHQTIPKI